MTITHEQVERDIDVMRDVYMTGTVREAYGRIAALARAVLDAPEVPVVANGCRVSPPRTYGRLAPTPDEFGPDYADTTFLGQFVGQRVRIVAAGPVEG